MHSASFRCASCFGVDAGPSVLSFLKESDPYFALTVTFDLLDPALGCIRPRQSAAEAFDVEVDGFAKGLEPFVRSRSELKPRVATAAMAAVYVP
jgi:hypothetical protein